MKNVEKHSLRTPRGQRTQVIVTQHTISDDEPERIADGYRGPWLAVGPYHLIEAGESTWRVPGANKPVDIRAITSACAEVGWPLPEVLPNSAHRPSRISASFPFSLALISGWERARGFSEPIDRRSSLEATIRQTKAQSRFRSFFQE